MSSENTLFDFADIASFLKREREKLSFEVKDHLRSAIIVGVNEWLSKFTEESELSETSAKNVVKAKIELEPAPSEEEKEETKPIEQPKRRGRKKQVVEQPEELPTTATTATTAPTTTPTTTPTTAYREIEFEKGLDKGLASFSTIDDVDDDKIVNEKLGPIPLANSLPKVGEHPFFKGPAQFVWYLEMDRWPLYLANLLEAKEFYPDQLSLYDTKRLEEAKKVGVDIEFIASLVNKDSKRMVSIEDFEEKEYADDEAGIEALMELKESGFLKKFVAEIDPEKKLLKFLTRFGQNKKIADDLQTIYEEHTEHPNKYIHW